MRTLAKTAVALGFIGATAIGTTATVQAQGFYFGFGNPDPYYHGYYRHRHYPRYYGGYASGPYNPCPMGYTVQGGRCQPYRGGYGYGYWR